MKEGGYKGARQHKRGKEIGCGRCSILSKAVVIGERVEWSEEG